MKSNKEVVPKSLSAVTDKDIIKELMNRGWTEKGARKALKGIKRGMDAVKKGRISKID